MDKNAYGVRLKAEPDHSKLGRKLTSAINKVATAIKALKYEDIEK